MNTFRCIYQGFCLFSRNTYIKKHLSSVCCEQNRSLLLGCFPHISPSTSPPSRLTENMRRNALHEKYTVDVKRKQFKKLSPNIWWHVLSEMGNGARMLWESFNFWFWNSFIRYFNSGISFVVFYLHISRDRIYISLDSNCIDIVTKFCHTRVVFFFLIANCFFNCSLPVSFEYQSVSQQVLGKTSQLKRIYN